MRKIFPNWRSSAPTLRSAGFREIVTDLCASVTATGTAFPPVPLDILSSSRPALFPASRNHRTMLARFVPLIPLKFRPKTGIANYHILFEAEWERVVPKDPLLLRRLGAADLWLVVAAWDLTEVEQAALAARVNAS